MNTEERLGKVERKVNTIEQALQILTELIVSHDERLIKSWSNNEDLNAKISALVDAQIRGEDKLQMLVNAQVRSESALEKLTRLVERFI